MKPATRHSSGHRDNQPEEQFINNDRSNKAHPCCCQRDSGRGLAAASPCLWR